MVIDDISFAPHSCAHGWLVASVGGRDARSVETDALRIQKAALEKGYFSVCGLLEGEHGYRLFLAPSNNVLTILKVFHVGSHAGFYDPDGHARALREVEMVHKRYPLIPYFADSAGFKARFTAEITTDLIHFLEDGLSDVEPMMDAKNGSIADYVKKHQGIHLWWD